MTRRRPLPLLRLAALAAPVALALALALVLPLTAQSPTLSRVTLTATRDTLAVGDSVDLTAAALGPSGAPVQRVAYTWGVGDPARAAYVDLGGGRARITALDTGAVDVVVVARGLAATRHLVVTPAAAAIAARVVRFDRGAGAVLVSAGVPFPPGWVTAGTLRRLRVAVAGAELPVLTRALAGRHPDGSLRAVLVQFVAVVPDTGLPATVLLSGTPRAAPDPPPRPPPAVPAAALLPTDPAYLVATGIAGPLTVAGADTGQLARQYEADFARLAADDWARCGAAWDCGRTAGYNRGAILYQAWLRTGDPTYWHHATAYVADYLTRYIAVTIGPAPWWALSEEPALHYWLTGDERSRTLLGKMAASLAAQVAPGSAGYQLEVAHGDDRLKARVLTAGIEAARLELTPAGEPLAAALDRVLAAQQPSGAWGGAQYQGGQSPFMVGMLLTALGRYYDEIAPDPRIPPAVARTLADLWAHEWDPAARGFRYVTHDVFDAAGTQTHWPVPEPGLNGLIAPAYAWWAAHAPDAAASATARARTDTILAGLAQPAPRAWWASSGKAFDQAYTRLFTVLAWRAVARQRMDKEP